MSTAPQDPAPAASNDSATPAKPQRSKVEQAVVWGVILIGGIIVLLEGKSYFEYKQVHSALLAELNKAETTDYHVTAAKVAEIVGDRAPDISKDLPVAVGQEHYDVFIYKGLLKERPVCVHYSVVSNTGEEAEVIEVTSIVPDELYN